MIADGLIYDSRLFDLLRDEFGECFYGGSRALGSAFTRPGSDIDIFVLWDEESGRLPSDVADEASSFFRDMGLPVERDTFGGFHGFKVGHVLPDELATEAELASPDTTLLVAEILFLPREAWERTRTGYRVAESQIRMMGACEKTRARIFKSVAKCDFYRMFGIPLFGENPGRFEGTRWP